MIACGADGGSGKARHSETASASEWLERSRWFLEKNEGKGGVASPVAESHQENIQGNVGDGGAEAARPAQILNGHLSAAEILEESIRFQNWQTGAEANEAA